MADEKKERIKEPLQNEFENLPLDEKIANLLKMEAVTLSETFAYAVKSPLEVVEKVGDVITDIGQRIETEAKKAWSAADAQTQHETVPNDPPAEPAPKKGGSKKSEPGPETGA
jgi:hypothetical protein